MLLHRSLLPQDQILALLLVPWQLLFVANLMAAVAGVDPQWRVGGVDIAAPASSPRAYHTPLVCIQRGKGTFQVFQMVPEMRSEEHAPANINPKSINPLAHA